MLYTILKARLAQQVLLRYSPSPHIDKILSLSRKVDFHFYTAGASSLTGLQSTTLRVKALIIYQASCRSSSNLSYHYQMLFGRGFEARISALNLARNISSFACNSKQYFSVFKIDRLNFIYPSSKFVLLLVVVRMMQYKYLLRICTQSLFRKKFDSNLQIGKYIRYTFFVKSQHS